MPVMANEPIILNVYDMVSRKTNKKMYVFIFLFNRISDFFFFLRLNSYICQPHPNTTPNSIIKNCDLKMRYTLANTFNANQVRNFVILRLMVTPLQFGICFQHQLCLF